MVTACPMPPRTTIKWPAGIPPNFPKPAGGRIVKVTTTATGVGTWTPTGTASRTYQVAYTVSNSAPDTTQGGTANLGLTWEAQS